ncbi:MAG: CotH kinase family protein, partial [Bacteroidota bacterium]
NYQFFKDKPISSFNEIKLRNSGQDWSFTMMQDGVLQTFLAGRMDIDQPAYRPSVVFLNGAYWGIHNIREMLGTDFIQENHGFDKNQIDMINYTGLIEIKEGDTIKYKELMDFVRARKLTDADNYEWVSKHMDIQEYINYQISQIFFANEDWPEGNMRFWRPRVENGVWRWILYDEDLAYQYPWTNSIHWATRERTPDSPGSTDLFRKLLENPDFKQLFMQTFQYHLNTTFKPERLLRITDSLRSNIDREMRDRHIDRWKNEHGMIFIDLSGQHFDLPTIKSYEVWRQNIERMNFFSGNRESFVRKHLQAYFHKGDPVPLKLFVDPPGAGNIFIGDWPITNSGETTAYYGDDTLSIKALPSPWYKLDRWEIKTNTIKPGDTVALIPAMSIWKYLDTGIYPESDWSHSDISNSWPEGQGILGYNNSEVATELSFGPDTLNKYISCLFTNKFTIKSAGQWKALQVSLLRDDGAIVYLNGTEVVRSNMPDTSNFTTLALTRVDGTGAVTYYPYFIPAELLRDGENIIGVEVHQVSPSSNDLTFDLSLMGVAGEDATDSRLLPAGEISQRFEWASEIIAHFSYTDEVPELSINEVMPANISIYPDRLGSYSYWIEIYNRGSSAANLSGLFITDDVDNPGKWKIPVGDPDVTSIPPDGYRILLADGRPGLGVDHLGFSIRHESRQLELSVKTSTGYTWIDTLTVSMLDADVSSGRYPDGGAERHTFTRHPTPGASNIKDEPLTIEETGLMPVYPNPFQEVAHICFRIRESSPVLISIRDLKGTLLRVLTNKGYESGEYQIDWDGKGPAGQNLAPGVYLVTMIVRDAITNCKIVLIE